MATTPKSSRNKISIGHETRIALTALVAGFPAVMIALVLLWVGDYSSKTIWTLSVLMLLFWVGFSSAVRAKVALPLQTISNVLASLREGDFSLRARGSGNSDALSEVVAEVNALSNTLKEQRLGAVEATALLRNVMQEIDVAIFAFDANHILRLVNRAGERLLDGSAEKLVGSSASRLGLAACLQGENARLMEVSFPGGLGRWEMRRSKFWQSGAPHHLLVLSDLSKALREEERQAWKRFIRVLGHELNNSLAPIKSIAASLSVLLDREPRPGDWEEDARRGLAVIENRSESLSRFMEGYAHLAQLPPPKLRPVDDEGPGISNTSNLFVPFFTTKPQGSGIGLALSRQIAEAHQGSLILGNRPGEQGCRALLKLPL
jgi:two-component system nitrogen regulation sensor histidine kinase NtrY